MRDVTMIPYQGKKPYVFVSCDSADFPRILPVLEQLFSRGYRIWFQSGSGLDSEVSAVHLLNCHAVLAFLSSDYAKSDSCRRELYYAMELNKPILSVFLEDTDLGDEIHAVLDSKKVIHKSDLDDDQLVDKIVEFPDVKPCKGKAPKPKNSETEGGLKPDISSFFADVSSFLKKNLGLLSAVAAVMVLLVIGYFTIHIWSDGSCTEAAVCKLCGKERASAGGHDWSEESCTQPRTCKKCFATDGIASGHDWQFLSCTEPYTCSICGAVNGTAPGHFWSEGSCESPAFCVVCGLQSEASENHHWMYATCTEPRYCMICGLVSGDPLGHQWLEATLTAPRTCLLCGLTEGEPLDDSYSRLDIGDVCTFGTYEQDNNMNNGTEDIEWIVLDKQGDSILLISKYALDCKPYHSGSEEQITWPYSSLRNWLNIDFLSTAFSELEQRHIQWREVTADPNPDFSTDPGEPIWDYVFLLSISEVMNYYPDSEDRICKVTAYAEAQGAFSHSDPDRGGWWWLRTPGEQQNFAASINSDGSFDIAGSIDSGDRGSVRPAMWITIG